MPSKRRTISELELIDELIGLALNKKTGGENPYSEHVMAVDEDQHQQYLDWKAGVSEKPEWYDEQNKPFEVARKARRTVAAQEMKKIRRELVPSPARGVERDRVRGALSLFRPLEDDYRTKPEAMLSFYKDIYPKVAPEIDAELARRKLSPIMRLMDRRGMSRRDLFRMGRGGAAKLAEMTPAGQMVKAAVAKESPLFVKFIKALLSRQFHY